MRELNTARTQEYLNALKALRQDAADAGEDLEFACAAAASLSLVLRDFPDTSVEAHFYDLHKLMTGVTSDIGGNRSDETKLALVEGFTSLMAWYHCKVKVTKKRTPKLGVGPI